MNLFSNPAYRSRLLFIPNISSLDISSLFDEKKLPDHDIDLEDAHLSNLSDDELRSFACKLSNRRPSSISRSLKERLENECCSRANRFDSVSLLFFADVFSRLHLDSVRYMSCVYRILYNHWDQLALEKEDVLLLTYFMVTFRTLTPQINFMHRIEHYVQTNMNKFSLNELSLICLAFFSTNTSFREHTTLENLSVKVLEDIHKTDLNLMHLCNILKVLRHARFTKLSFYEQLADPIILALSKSKQKANFMELNHIATTYSALKIYHQKLFDTIKQQAVDILANKETRYIFRMKDLTRLVWALSTFANHVPKPILDKLVETMNNDKRMLTLYSESFTEALLSLAMNRVYPDNLLTFFFSPEFLKLKSG